MKSNVFLIKLKFMTWICILIVLGVNTKYFFIIMSNIRYLYIFLQLSYRKAYFVYESHQTRIKNQKAN